MATLQACANCGGDVVNLTGVEFPSGTNCECRAATRINIGTGVKIKNGATVLFSAPIVNIGSGFQAEEGATVRIKQE